MKLNMKNILKKELIITKGNYKKIDEIIDRVYPNIKCIKFLELINCNYIFFKDSKVEYISFLDNIIETPKYYKLHYIGTSGDVICLNYNSKYYRILRVYKLNNLNKLDFL